MMRDDIRLELNGFGANSKFGTFAKGLIDELYLEAPSDSSLTASFTRFDNVITGAIQISSSQGVFSANANGRDARKVALKTVHSVRKQLQIWKRSRWGQKGFPLGSVRSRNESTSNTAA